VPDPRWSAEGEGYLVYRRPGKRTRRPPTPVRDDGPDDTTRSEGVAQQPSRERSKPNASRKSDHGGREGTGEGELVDQADELALEDHAPW